MSLVRSMVSGAGRLVPPSRRLAYEYWRRRVRGRLEGELERLEELVDRREVAIDIGANLGLYTYRMAGLFRRVMAFEPNEGILRDLRAAGLPNVTIHPVALSSEPADARRLYIPRANGVEQDGWASFDPGNLPDATSTKELEVPVRTLDSFEFRDVSFIKIDVEGHEMDVLRGAVETIERWRPVVLAEGKRGRRGDLLGFFEARGYEVHQWRAGGLERVPDGTGDELPLDNFVFRPATREGA